MADSFHLYLIRHAQSANNALPESQRVHDPPITQQGERQVESLAERFRGETITHCLTSGFLRAVQTMRPVAKAVGKRPAIWTELHEVGGCFSGYQHGKLEGRPGMNRATLSTDFPDFDLPDDICDKGWWKSKPYEDYADARLRAEAQSKRLLEEFRGTGACVACVIHADFKAMMLESLLGDQISVSAIDLMNTGVSKLLCAGETVEAIELNDASHLPHELVSS